MEQRNGIIIDTDNLIAATSIHHSLELYTDNLKHFTFIEELILFDPGNR